jgi:hypothetical protein
MLLLVTLIFQELRQLMVVSVDQPLETGNS